MTGLPEHQWGFIRKVYILVSLQLLFTVTFAFASFFIFFPLARNYFLDDDDYNGLSALFKPLFVFFGPIIFTITLTVVMSKSYYEKHPVNLFLLGFYTLGTSVAVGFACAVAKACATIASVDLETLPGVVVALFTICTFVAVKRDIYFGFHELFPFASLVVITLLGIIQVEFPLGTIGRMVFAGLGSLIMCSFIVHDTCNLIKRYNYDEYIWATIVIYVDIVSLSINLLSFLKIKT